MRLPNLRRVFARFHGGIADEAPLTDVVKPGVVKPGQSDELKSAYAEYASATAETSAMLQKHGAQSPQFASADVASMRLFHRVKKMQGLKKSRLG